MTAKAETYTNGQSARDAGKIVDTAKDKLNDSMSEARDALDTATQRASEEVRKAADQTTTFVRENPGTALLGALGLGVLVGLAMRSR